MVRDPERDDIIGSVLLGFLEHPPKFISRKMIHWRIKDAAKKISRRDRSEILTTNEILDKQEVLSQIGEDLLEARDRLDDAMKTIQMLKTEQEVIFLRFYKNLTLEEIGRRFGKSRNWVDHLIQRVLGRIREGLGLDLIKERTMKRDALI